MRGKPDNLHDDEFNCRILRRVELEKQWNIVLKRVKNSCWPWLYFQLPVNPEWDANKLGGITKMSTKNIS